MNSKDCTYVPQYSVPTDEGSTVVQIRNDTADRPGYTMPTGGWSADPNATEPDPQYDAYKKIDVANDPNAKDGVLVLYAVWHVYADLQYFNDWNHFSWGKVNHSLDTIKDINQVAKEVTATPAEGYRFKEWRDSSATVVSTNPVFRPEKSKTNDGIDVYVSNRYSAYFEPIISTVTFETNGGLPIPSQAVAYNEKAVKTEAEMLEPCATFAGWYEDKELTKEFSFDQPIREDMTLYAKWERHHNTMVHVDEEAATCV
ncbi:MAG: InlB B-repeat-containing protein, partial [Firmicutes bacterium]|nr:InlB B-repeat-containing protein [Bacillota bacterium]